MTAPALYSVLHQLRVPPSSRGDVRAVTCPLRLGKARLVQGGLCHMDAPSSSTWGKQRTGAYKNQISLISASLLKLAPKCICLLQITDSSPTLSSWLDPTSVFQLLEHLAASGRRKASGFHPCDGARGSILPWSNLMEDNDFTPAERRGEGNRVRAPPGTRERAHEDDANTSWR